MLEIVITNQFKKDMRKALKQAKGIESFFTVVSMLINQTPLPARYREHRLVGDYADRLECHILPDLLLIYRVEEGELILERMGSHSDLFG